MKVFIFIQIHHFRTKSRQYTQVQGVSKASDLKPIRHYFNTLSSLFILYIILLFVVLFLLFPGNRISLYSLNLVTRMRLCNILCNQDGVFRSTSNPMFCVTKMGLYQYITIEDQWKWIQFLFVFLYQYNDWKHVLRTAFMFICHFHVITNWLIPIVSRSYVLSCNLC